MSRITTDYQRGYRAGKKSQTEAENFNAAFLQVLPACIPLDNWHMDGELADTLQKKVALAVEFATAAAKEMR